MLGDFLSRQKHNDSNACGIIPILLNMQNVLQTRFYSTGEREQGKHLVQTRSEAKSSGIILAEVHGIDKGIDPNIRIEKQAIKPVTTPQMHILPEAKNIPHIKPGICQGRAGIKRKMFKFPVSKLYDKPEQPK